MRERWSARFGLTATAGSWRRLARDRARDLARGLSLVGTSLVGVGPGGVTAQERVDAVPAVVRYESSARRHLPRDHDLVLSVDVLGWHEIGVVDELLRFPPVSLGHGWLESQLGFEIEAIDHLQLALRRGERDAVLDWLIVVQGTEAVQLRGMAGDFVEGASWRQQHGVGVYGDADFALASPRDGLLLLGDPGAVDTALDPEFRGGVPLPEVLALAVGKPALLSLAWKVNDPQSMLPRNTPLDPHVTVVGASVRLRALLEPGGEARPGLTTPLRGTLRLRFAAPGAGPQTFAKDWEMQLRDAAEEPNADLFPEWLALYERTVIETDGRDLTATLDVRDSEEFAARTAGDAVKSVGYVITAIIQELVRAIGDALGAVPVPADEPHPDDLPPSEKRGGGR